MSYLVTYTADADIAQLCNDLANDGLENYADTLDEELLVAFTRLGEMPGRGHRREDLTVADVLFYKVLRYYSIYRLIDDGVVILRIVPTASDIERLWLP